jgi:hypothetical protein
VYIRSRPLRKRHCGRQSRRWADRASHLGRRFPVLAAVRRVRRDQRDEVALEAGAQPLTLRPSETEAGDPASQNRPKNSLASTVPAYSNPKRFSTLPKSVAGPRRQAALRCTRARAGTARNATRATGPSAVGKYQVPIGEHEEFAEVPLGAGATVDPLKHYGVRRRAPSGSCWRSPGPASGASAAYYVPQIVAFPRSLMISRSLPAPGERSRPREYAEARPPHRR